MKHQDLRSETVEAHMNTNLVTVRPDESIQFAANLMTWHKIRHVPVEDADGHLIGLLSILAIVDALARQTTDPPSESVIVSDIMAQSPVTISPDTSLQDVVELMICEDLSCLPVVAAGRLLGIMTERDALLATSRILGQKNKK